MSEIKNIDGVDIEITDNGEIRYEAGAEIDADGAPNAYALPGSGLQGLDNIRNALHNVDDPLNLNSDGILIPPPNGWAGVVCNENGDPLIQQDGPYAGYCLSATALQDHEHNLPLDDYRRYVDASRIAYISIPPALEALGVRLGDACLVAERDTAKSIQAIVADIGPRRKLGEVSIFCAQGCGFASSPRNGGISHGVIIRIFLNSAKSPAWDYRRTQADVALFVDAFASQT